VTACQQGTTSNTGGPLGWSRGPTDVMGIWAEWVAEGLIAPRKPGNAGGGKEPWLRGAEEAARGERRLAMSRATPEQNQTLQRRLCLKAKRNLGCPRACLEEESGPRPDAGNPHVRFGERG
jgi:hypothetical protein